MSIDSARHLRPMAPGAILALLSIAFGFVLGGLFGVAEDSIKDRLHASAERVLESTYGGDTAKANAVVSRSWSYLKRAHLHGGGIGAAALSSILLLGLFGEPGRVERWTGIAFGAGALLYAVFWLAAGLTAPGLGGTRAAKEALQFLAIPGAGLCLVGIGGTLFSVVRRLLAAPGDKLSR